MYLSTLANKAKSIDVEKLALDITKKNSGLVSKRIKQQLTVGENADGARIGTLKTPRYATSKKRRGGQAPFGVPDLKLSGNLYKGLKTKVSANFFETASSVSYSGFQVDRYGIKIYELQKDNSKDIKFKNGVDTIKEYSRQLGL